MKKKITKILSVLFITLFTLTNISSAQLELYVTEKSEAYKQWETLSPEKRKTTIQPPYYSISLKNSIKRSKYNALLAGEVSSEDTYYNLAENYSTIVKDQKRTGACWAFSTTSMLESSIAVGKNLLGKQYSPFHMEYSTYQMYKRDLGVGGNIYLALAYLVNGRGPVLESDFTIESVYDEENNSSLNYYLTDIQNVDLNKETQLKINHTTEFGSIYKEYAEGSLAAYVDAGGNEYSADVVEAFRTKVKSHIKDYGAVTATMYIDIAINTGGQFVSDYYDSVNNIFCCTDSSSNTMSNHQVTIVGWDDDEQAYIVQNSYGTTFGENGYFYISYDDARIEESIYGITDIEQLTANNYDNIYMHDELGMNQVLSLGTSEIYYANVFTRNPSSQGKEEYVNEVGVYIANTSGIEIYVNASDGDLDENLKLVSSGEILEAGYHVIKLNATDDTKLTGDKFAIAVKATNAEGAYLPIECDLYESGFSFSSTYFDKATANLGESFFSTDRTNWYEINNQKVGYMYTLKDTNVCVRAFTKYADTSSSTAVDVTEVRLDNTSVTLKEEETETLTATVLPENASNKNVTWESSDEEVATVAGGVVTAVKAGTATITVKTVDGNYTATCNVTVQPKTINVIGISLDKTAGTLKIGETLTLTATITPSNATNKNVIWTSSDEEVATILGGVVTAVRAGTATITAKTQDGNYTANCLITIEGNQSNEVNVTGVSLDKQTITLKEEETETLTATVLPENASNKNVTWESLDEEVATVAGGVVTAIKAGTATITVKTVDGNYTATCNVTVQPKTINVTGISLDKTAGTLEIGETLNLTATVTPANATNKNIIWTSSDEEVATVAGGVVTAIRAGTTTITAKTQDAEFTASCTVTVEENTEIRVESIELDKTEIQMEVTDTATLVVKFNPMLPTNTNIKWTSSNTNIVTVDENGIIKAVGEGKSTITATSEDGGHTAICKVTVTKQVEDPDDIYKDGQGGDGSLSKDPLPNTGITTIIFSVIGTMLIIMLYTRIKYKGLKDVK